MPSAGKIESAQVIAKDLTRVGSKEPITTSVVRKTVQSVGTDGKGSSQKLTQLKGADKGFAGTKLFASSAGQALQSGSVDRVDAAYALLTSDDLDKATACGVLGCIVNDVKVRG